MGMGKPRTHRGTFHAGARTWLLLPARLGILRETGYTYKLFSENSIVKAGNITEYKILGDPPPELEEFREVNGFDFGKFDYVEHDGRPILLDINKTPTIVSSGAKTRMQQLSEGLSDFTGAS